MEKVKQEKIKKEEQIVPEVPVALVGLVLTKSGVERPGEAATGVEAPREVATRARRLKEAVTRVERLGKAVIVRAKRSASLSSPAFLLLSIFLSSSDSLISK